MSLLLAVNRLERALCTQTVLRSLGDVLNQFWSFYSCRPLFPNSCNESFTISSGYLPRGCRCKKLSLWQQLHELSGLSWRIKTASLTAPGWVQFVVCEEPVTTFVRCSVAGTQKWTSFWTEAAIVGKAGKMEVSTSGRTGQSWRLMQVKFKCFHLVLLCSSRTPASAENTFSSLEGKALLVFRRLWSIDRDIFVCEHKVSTCHSHLMPWACVSLRGLNEKHSFLGSMAMSLVLALHDCVCERERANLKWICRMLQA